MTIDKETRTTIKNSIKALVAQKVKLTRERREYKLKTRGKIDESTRRAFFWNIDSDRASLKHDIRHGLLLYGYIRGRDYSQLEAKVRDGNSPSPSDVCLFGDEHAELCLRATEVEQWLGGEPSPHRWSRPEVEEAA